MRLCFDARVAGAVLALAAAREASAGAQGAGIAGVSAFDSVSASPAPVAAESLLSRAGWVRVPDGALTNRFRGDAVLMNGRLAVVLRANAAGAEVYSAAAGGMKLRAVVTPLVAEGGGRFASVKLDQNGPDSVRALAKFVTATNRALTLTCEVGVGQPFARTDIDDGAARLRVEAPCRFLVIPEFAKGRDDALVDAAKTQGDAAPVPDANFLLHLLDGGDAVVAVARDLRQGGARLQAVGQGGARVIAATEVPYGKGGQVWVGVIEGPGAWQEAGPAGAARQPYPAGWRTVPGDPGVTYPRDRDQKTPIEVFTVVDLIRAALGPGPCRYILDLDEVLVNIGLQSARSGPKGRALTQAQISAWLAGENARQKQLRSELADLAKAGQRIYYNSNFEGEQKIYAVAPDGSGFARITPASWTNDQQYPHVSPDGSKLVFSGGRLSKQECMNLPSDPDYLIAKGARWGLLPIVWMANVDGSDSKPVVMGSCPHWSWDGRYLAYGVQPKPNVRCLGLLDVEKGREWIFRVAGGNTPTFSRDMKYYIGGAHYIQSVRMEDIMTGTNHTPAAVFNSYGCNQEISPDGKALVHVIDEKDGSWICWYPYNPARSVGARGQAVDLGVTRNSMNYFPEFSPDQKYMAWGHWDEWENRGAKNVNPYNTTAADLYVCRWPPDGVSARITWHGGTTQNPSWAGWGTEMKRGDRMRRLAVTGWVAASLLLAAGAAETGAAAAGTNATGRTTVLDTHSFWRCFFVMREPVVDQPAGAAAEAAQAARKGSGIKYHTSLPPADWPQPDFDDSGWSRRPGPFFPGFGFQQPVTVGLLCLRATFSVEDPARAGDLTLSAVFRGGIVVYVNGREVGRKHVGAGGMEALAEGYPPEAYATAAGAIIERHSEGQNAERCNLRIRALEGLAIPASALRKGVNVVAVEMHRPPVHPIASTLADSWKGAWNPTGLLSVEVSAAGAGVTPNLVRPAGLQMWNADPITPVFDADYGDPNAKLRPVRIVGTRNGAFSGQVVIGDNVRIKGLGAVMGDLKHAGGKGVIAASAVQVRYSQPGGGAGGAGGRYPGVNGVTMFDTLSDSAPAEVPVLVKTMQRGYQGRAPVFGAVQPVWLTVNVPRDAAPGEYEGALAVSAGGATVSVPVSLRVCDWPLPETRDFAMHADLVESPESVALRYNVPYWSDAHFKLIGRSLGMLGKVANKTIYIHLICRTNHGNSETMVRWVGQGAPPAAPEGGTNCVGQLAWKAGDRYGHDFTIMEKYLDLCIEKAGKPQFVIFYVSDAYTGQGYFGKATSRVKKTGAAVTTVGADGRIGELEGPLYDDQAAAVEFWKPVAEGIRERLKKRGLENAWHIGLASDRKPHESTVTVWKTIAPEAKWVHQGHGQDGNYFGVPVGYNTTVWTPKWAADPDVKRTYGWAEARKVAYFHRDIHRMEAVAQLLETRLIGEKNIQGRQCGFGRFNADFWPVIKDSRTGQLAYTISSRYPETTWAQCNISMTAYLAPGPEGAASTVRYEMMREGIEECEARIFVEKALLDKARRARLGEEAAARIQGVLDDRTRAINCAGGELGTYWYSSSGWQERSARLFCLAGEIEGLLTSKGRSVRLAVEP